MFSYPKTSKGTRTACLVGVFCGKNHDLGRAASIFSKILVGVVWNLEAIVHKIFSFFNCPLWAWMWQVLHNWIRFSGISGPPAPLEMIWWGSPPAGRPQTSQVGRRQASITAWLLILPRLAKATPMGWLRFCFFSHASSVDFFFQPDDFFAFCQGLFCDRIIQSLVLLFFSRAFDFKGVVPRDSLVLLSISSFPSLEGYHKENFFEKIGGALSLIDSYNISTSYFSICADNPSSLSICPRTPPWYAMGRAEDIMCSKELYDAYFKRFSLTKEEFYKGYVEQTLSKLDPVAVLEKYRGKILLGYYRAGRFDCRTMFARWIKEQTGIVIPEYDSRDRGIDSLFTKK